MNTIGEHVTAVGGNIFADPGFPPEEAENLLIRGELMIEIIGIIQDRGLKQKRRNCSAFRSRGSASLSAGTWTLSPSTRW